MNLAQLAQPYSETKQFLAELWSHLWLTDHRAAQVIVASVTILISIFIGGMYADMPFVSVFPILFWLLAVIICFLMLFP